MPKCHGRHRQRRLAVGRFAEDADSAWVSLATIRTKLTEASVNWARVSLRGYARCEVRRLEVVGLAQAETVDDQPTAANPDQPIDVDAPGTLGQLVHEHIQAASRVPADELVVDFDENDASRLAGSTIAASAPAPSANSRPVP